MRVACVGVLIAGLLSSVAPARVLQGPARFCGYSPIIDLTTGESVETLDGGIHGGSFRWQGAFGTLHVSGIGWASKPKGRIAGRTSSGLIRFKERRDGENYIVAIWNGHEGAAYFSSPQPINRAQLAAIDRVKLFQESFDDEAEPKDCSLRTKFVWE